uniref:Uncharacterized protein n=1 Tax=Oryza nivara TaxID=4536 RepID=A0A0E0GNT8_ORYNI
MVVTEQEPHAAGLTERFVEVLNYYAALFDCLEVGGARGSVERTRVERWLLGEEIKNIVVCDGGELRERHERLEGAGFGRVPLSYYALLQARRVAQGLRLRRLQGPGGEGQLLPLLARSRPLLRLRMARPPLRRLAPLAAIDASPLLPRHCYLALLPAASPPYSSRRRLALLSIRTAQSREREDEGREEGKERVGLFGQADRCCLRRSHADSAVT